MKILIVGNGGREHALLWKLREDAPEAEFFITSGNGGTAGLATSLPLGAGEFQALAGWAQKEGVALTVVGPESPLAEGIVDHFSARGLPAFGPSRAAAEIESSKAFAKSLMERYRIPTAPFRSFTALPDAEAYLDQIGAPMVVKASGLAAGKGAVVCSTVEEARSVLREMLGGAYGEAGKEVVIEEFMPGEELSVLALTDGTRVLPLLPAQDHKRIGEGDTGLNTGGMGAYSPVVLATPALMERVTAEILLPTVVAMQKEERPFRGLLYAGLMITAGGPKVVEFNCRFGDPETQAILPLLESSLLEPMLAIATGGSLEGMEMRWRSGAAVTTVLASEGYPGDHRTGLPIEIPAELQHDPSVLLFHAATAHIDGALRTTGGRVMAVTGLGATIQAAAARSRAAAGAIRFEGRYLRRDIGWREIARAKESGA